MARKTRRLDDFRLQVAPKSAKKALGPLRPVKARQRCAGLFHWFCVPALTGFSPCRRGSGHRAWCPPSKRRLTLDTLSGMRSGSSPCKADRVHQIEGCREIQAVLFAVRPVDQGGPPAKEVGAAPMRCDQKEIVASPLRYIGCRLFIRCELKQAGMFIGSDGHANRLSRVLSFVEVLAMPSRPTSLKQKPRAKAWASPILTGSRVYRAASHHWMVVRRLCHIRWPASPQRAGHLSH